MKGTITIAVYSVINPADETKRILREIIKADIKARTGPALGTIELPKPAIV